MLTLLLAACIETGIVPSDPADTDVVIPLDTDLPPDTDVPDTDVPVDTDIPVDTDVVDTDLPVDTDVPEPDGPIAVNGACATTYTSWADTAPGTPELHVVGMYESQSGNPGPAAVSVVRTNEMVLVLTSYSAVNWQVTLDPASRVDRIIVSDIDGTSSVLFTTATTTTVHTIGWIGSCGYEIPDLDLHSGCETPDLQADVERRTGLVMSSFQGCYAGGSFVVD